MNEALAYVRNGVEAAIEELNYEFFRLLNSEEGYDLPGVGIARLVAEYKEAEESYAELSVIFSVNDVLYRLQGESDSWEGGYPDWEPLSIHEVVAYDYTETRYKRA